jgi:hypothetical protein
MNLEVLDFWIHKRGRLVERREAGRRGMRREKEGEIGNENNKEN